MASTPGKYNKFFAYTESVGELIILNLLTVLCCIPVVTFGASISAMNDVLIRKKHDEPYSIAGSFFKAFKNNFRHATGTWLIFAGIFLFLWWDFELWYQAAGDMPRYFEILIITAFVICFAAAQWASNGMLRFIRKHTHRILSLFSVNNFESRSWGLAETQVPLQDKTVFIGIFI